MDSVRSTVTTVSSTVGSAVGSALGSALGGVTRVAAAIRPAAKPLHPRGEIRHGRLHRHGAEPPTGVRFLDEVAADDVLVRESRAAGLPRPLPDIHGLALRVPNPDATVGDLLLATTGFGLLSRFVLIPTRSPYGRPMTTLLPYETVAGPVLLGVHRVAGGRLELVFAVGDGAWRPFAELVLGEPADDADVSFDAVRNTLPGLEQFAAVRRLRAPAYAAARAARSAD
ncbi:MAG TPA: hypothetical protein VFV89_04020 [Nocardioides sp.]|uniref:hypothetical protein n=1 Tax=Nocardioides sp. TaxID=35761 RepID=UPI002E363AA2|nr:hypothetical protein [Nocardioides sp.]HEX5086950.1 hypothetical protein [Nocardioides sp.]